MSMTPAGIEPATFLFVAQHLNHCATADPNMVQVELNNMYINTGANNGSEKLWTKKKHRDFR